LPDATNEIDVFDRFNCTRRLKAIRFFALIRQYRTFKLEVW